MRTALLIWLYAFIPNLVNASSPSPVAKTNGPSAQQILEKAEIIRSPDVDYTTVVKLEDDKGKGEKPEIRLFESSIKGRDKALIRYIADDADRGTKVLMIGQDMWVQVPKKSVNAVRISTNQKLTGNAAYGDVARLVYLGNYTAKINREDILNGEKAYVLDLESIQGRPVTYDKIEYWISMTSFRPLKTIYKSFSNKEIREGTFADYVDVLGVQRPRKFILKNLLRTNHITTLSFSDVKATKLSDLLFQKQNLGR